MKHLAIVDLGYGDAGKGAVVNRLCAEGGVSAVVRFNGGCQAAHNVVTDTGHHHTFAQFGSGTFQGVRTHLSRFMLVEPLSLMIEAEHLREVGIADPYYYLTVSPDALITTPYHWIVNRYREDQRGDGRHGSCGRGVGATVEYSLAYPELAPTVGDLYVHSKELMRKLDALQEWAMVETNGTMEVPDRRALLDDYITFINLVKMLGDEQMKSTFDNECLIFEGAQGVLLDEHMGFHPYTTWSTVTPDNAWALASEMGDDLQVIGVTRAYSTRHGAGPFVPEDDTLNLPEAHNKLEHYQGGWRVGHLDVPALRYAIEACGTVDGLYVTHVDTAESEPNLKVCLDYVDSEGASEPITHYNRSAFVPRADQSARLMKARPVLSDRPQRRWEDSVSELLDLPLYGVGRGPKTGDGTFLARRR